MRKTLRGRKVSQKSTAVGRKAAIETRHWFAYSIYSDKAEPAKEEGERPPGIPKDWEMVESFVSWNEHEDGLTLYIDTTGRVFLIGGEPWKRELSYPEVMRFYSDMFRQCKEGGDYPGIETLFDAVAVALERGSK